MIPHGLVVEIRSCRPRQRSDRTPVGDWGFKINLKSFHRKIKRWSQTSAIGATACATASPGSDPIGLLGPAKILIFGKNGFFVILCSESSEIFSTRFLESQVLTQTEKHHIWPKKRKPEFWGASGLGM